MAIRYEIDPGFDLLLYIFEGECSAREYFDLYHSIYLRDPRRHHGMKILMDLTSADFYFEPRDLHEATSIMEINKQNGHPRDHVAILSKSSGMGLLADTLKVLGDNVPMDLELFHTIHEAVRWLGLADQEKEAIFFWQEFTKDKK